MTTARTLLAVSVIALATAGLAACGSKKDSMAGGKTTMSDDKSMASSSTGTSQMAMAAKHWTVMLDGKDEVPPTPSAGTGTADISYDESTNMLSWSVATQGLSGPATAAHFHGPAAPGQNAKPTVDIGKMDMTSPMEGSAHLTDQQESDLMAGMWYLNVHTAKYPNGEIRGQVKPGM